MKEFCRKGHLKSSVKRLLALLMSVCLIGTMIPVTVRADSTPATGQYTIGSETVTAYVLDDADDLYWFAEQVNSGRTTINAVLTADIVVNTNVLDANGDPNSGNFTSWTPIGNEEYMYNGKFDGQGHTISGLYVNSNNKYIGLFGYLDTQACIYHVGVVDSYFSGYERIGGFCGATSGANGRATIQYCYTTATVNGNNCVGGFLGYNSNTLLYRCFSAGKVSGTDNVGPFFGELNQCYATNCYALADEAGSSNGVGYKTADQFKSGEVAYQLNYPDNGDASYWKQTIGTHSIPQYSGMIVYYGDGQYHNHTDSTATHCLLCGTMETLNGVYQIKTKDQLYWFAALVNGTDGLTQNASAKAVLRQISRWIPIGRLLAIARPLPEALTAEINTPSAD